METMLAGPGLEQFRRDHLAGGALLDRLAGCDGKMLVSVGVGVGKSTALDNVTEEAVRSGQYDLVVVLCPTRRVLKERRWVKTKPADVDVRVIKRRPSARCGAGLDRQWKRYEQNGMGLLGRVTLCENCPARQGCPWVRQYGTALRGAKVIFATQAHLQRDPGFIDTLAGWVGAKRVLTLVDENDFVLASCERTVAGRDLYQFRTVIDNLPLAEGPAEQSRQRWAGYVKLLQAARRDDLFSTTWAAPPSPRTLALPVQEAGHRSYGDGFRYIADDLRAFGRSRPATRGLLPDGGVRFTVWPRITSDLIVFSGTCVPEFVQFRVGLNLADPFADLQFRHPDTKWFNIASRLGARTYFRKNSPQILDFFAGLVARRYREGKRCLLISKKEFVPNVADQLQRRFKAMGSPLTVKAEDFTAETLARPETVPLIHYGVIGTNDFEAFDCAYCLNSYNVNERVIDGVVQDLVRAEHHVPLSIGYAAGRPFRRQVTVEDRQHRYTDVAQVANLALQHKEMDVVLQAVGRVRPYTRPREIILFQCGAHPQVRYDNEFNTLDEARNHFGILTRREKQVVDRRKRVAEARGAGLTQSQAAELLSASVKTIERYWNQPVTSPL